DRCLQSRLALGCSRTTRLIPAPKPRSVRMSSRTEHPVGGALDHAWSPVQDVGVDLRRAHVAVAEQFLNRPDVVAVLEQVRGERVAERVATRGLGDAGPTDGVLDRALQHRLM